MTYHVLGYKNRNKFISIVNCNSMTYKSGEIIEALAHVLTTAFFPDSFIAKTFFSSFTLIYGPFFSERLIVYLINQIISFFFQ